MQPELVAGRQRGQVLVIMALAIMALMGIAGVAVDLGFAYAHRREVQNAADAAALAGAIKLGQHYNATKNTGLPTPTPTAQTDRTILQDITNAAVAALPPFPPPSTDLTWPPAGTEGTNTLTAFYMTGETTPGAQITNSSSAPPTTAVGVRVVATASYATFFARVMGPSFNTMPVTGQARALLRPVTSAPGGPFIICGGGGGSGLGANITGPPGDTNVGPSGVSDVGRPRVILTPGASGQPATIGANFVGNVFMAQGAAIQNPTGTNCGDGGFHGNADPTTPCDPTGSTPLPCTMAAQNGDRAGPTRNLVSGLAGCSGITDDNGCVVILPIADTSPSNNTMNIVTYAAFTLYRGSHTPDLAADDDNGCSSSNCHTAVLLGAAMIDGSAGTGVIDPDNPGVFTVQLSPE